MDIHNNGRETQINKVKYWKYGTLCMYFEIQFLPLAVKQKCGYTTLAKKVLSERLFWSFLFAC